MDVFKLAIQASLDHLTPVFVRDAPGRLRLATAFSTQAGDQCTSIMENNDE